MLKRFFIIICVLVMVSVPTLTAFADTTEGFLDGAQTTVTVDGDVQPLQISITHPISVTWQLKFNVAFYSMGLNANTVDITNNTPAPVKLTVQSFKTTGGTYQFTDVFPNHFSNWGTLNKADSEKYIALYLYVYDTAQLTDLPVDGLWKTEISPSYTIPVHFAAQETPTYLGTMPANGTAKLGLTGTWGNAISQNGTSVDTLILQFNLA